MKPEFHRKRRQANSQINAKETVLGALCEKPLRPLRLIFSVALVIFLASFVPAQTKPGKDYLVYVVSESADRIALIRFGPGGARIDHDLQTGDMPVDIDGPHGIAISPDRQFYYVSIAHGRPFGSIWKYSTRRSNSSFKLSSPRLIVQL